MVREGQNQVREGQSRSKGTEDQRSGRGREDQSRARGREFSNRGLERIRIRENAAGFRKGKIELAYQVEVQKADMEYTKPRLYSTCARSRYIFSMIVKTKWTVNLSRFANFATANNLGAKKKKKHKKKNNKKKNNKTTTTKKKKKKKKKKKITAMGEALAKGVGGGGEAPGCTCF